MTGLLSVFVLTSSIFATPAPSAPALCSNAPARVMQAAFQSGETTNATCIANCGTLNPNISCNYASTCTAVDASCPVERGYVICDGITYYCNACCTDGQIRNVTTGPTCGCPDGMSTPKDRYQCVNGNWEYQYSFCGGPFCQGGGGGGGGDCCTRDASGACPSYCSCCN